jgi:hypothetical protein
MEAFAPMDHFVPPLMTALLDVDPRPWRMDPRQQPTQAPQETAEVGGQHHGSGANA